MKLKGHRFSNHTGLLFRKNKLERDTEPCSLWAPLDTSVMLKCKYKRSVSSDGGAGCPLCPRGSQETQRTGATLRWFRVSGHVSCWWCWCIFQPWVDHEKVKSATELNISAPKWRTEAFDADRYMMAVTAAGREAAALQATWGSDATAAWRDGWVFSFLHEIIPQPQELYFQEDLLSGWYWHQYFKAEVSDNQYF